MRYKEVYCDFCYKPITKDYPIFEVHTLRVKVRNLDKQTKTRKRLDLCYDCFSKMQKYCAEKIDEVENG